MVDARVFFRPEFTLCSSASHLCVYREGADTYTSIRKDNGKIAQIQVEGTTPRGQECFGVMGIANLQATKYLAIITEALFVGNIKGAKVFRVEQVEFCPYAPPSVLAVSQSKRTDDQYIDMYQEIIRSKSLYFSYDYDLTHSLQSCSDLQKTKKSQHQVLRTEYRFFWNFFLAEDLINSLACDVLVPVISGFVQIECAHFGGNEVELALISRRDHRRAGVRFQTRGLDADGCAANFVETEQILVLHKNNRFSAASFVQIRGSIPLRWQQKPNLKWSPKGVVVGSAQHNLEAAEKHFSEVLDKYGDIYIVNLIDKKGNQNELGLAFKTQIELLKTPRIHFTWFDFHHECKANHWENLSKLVREVDSLLDQFNFFRCAMDTGGDWGDETVEERQVGVFRTNCMDCLDRTNVVQSVLARNVLHRQLNVLGLAAKPTGDAFQALPGPLENCFRTFWVNNANVISTLYAGTGALKVDFTLTGKRTKQGAIDDGKNALQRYVINNFYDGSRKNSIDAFLGKVTPLSKAQPTFNRHSALYRLGLILVLCLILAHIAGKATGEGWSYFFGLVLGILVLQKAMTVNGRSLVDRPLLDS